jgi:hypothetical protein
VFADANAYRTGNRGWASARKGGRRTAVKGIDRSEDALPEAVGEMAAFAEKTKV